MDRRTFLQLATAASAFVTNSGAAISQSSLRSLPKLPMINLTDGIDDRIALNLVQSIHDFGNGAKSDTFGINNNYLGPVLKVKQGQTLPISVANSIREVTTIHWHGLHIPGVVDGGPHQEIEPGQTWKPDIPIVQSASMNWFHSHTHGRTASQTYKGLAGVMLIEDEGSLSADLPKTNDVDDFTLVLQDKTFDRNGKMSYTLTGTVFEEGFVGDTLVVNGTIAPVVQAVPAGLVRLRILNACNASFLTLSMESGPLHVIASDGGFLSSTVEADSILMSPGERYEILVDMNAVETNRLMVSHKDEDEGVLSSLAGLFGTGGKTIPALTLTRNSERGFTGSIPDRLANLTMPDPRDAKIKRSFQLNMGTSEELAALAFAWGNICGEGVGGMGINGQPMKMDRIDEEVRKGETEIWRIASDEQLHPFHIHGCSFQILRQNGSEPPDYARGWKDMVHVEDGWSEVVMRFDHNAPETSPYMYHCHILEHEDCGMMGQFTVT